MTTYLKEKWAMSCPTCGAEDPAEYSPEILFDKSGKLHCYVVMECRECGTTWEVAFGFETAIVLDTIGKIRASAIDKSRKP
jgi:uncharacterized Zn finger protein